MYLIRHLPLCILFVIPFLAQAADKTDAPRLSSELAPSYIQNGDFESALSEGQVPESWRAGTEGKIERLNEEDGYAYMRLTALAENQLVQLVQDAPLPEGLKGVVFHARFRNENVQFGKGGWLCDARARFRFYDADMQPVGPKLKDIIFFSQAQPWTQISRDYLVPEGAAYFRVNLCLNRPKSGILDLDEVRLLAMSEDRFQELEAARLEKIRKKEAEALKKVEDEKIIQTMLQAEPKTRQLGVYGNRLVNADHETVILKGLNIVSLEWSPKGEHIHRSVKVALQEWHANAIRLPVHHGFWFGEGKGSKIPSNDAAAYRQIVDDAVAMAAGEGAYVILDLHSYGAPQEFARRFWLDAAAHYANNPAVLFDLYNEPHGIDWELWRNGGEKEVKKKGSKEPVTVQVVGMQALVEAVRSTGARNVIIAGGLSYALDLRGILNGYALEEQAGGFGIMYATHFYNWHGGWQKHFLDIAEKYPVLVGEFGADKKKMSFIPGNQQENPYTWVPDALGMVQKYNLNYTGFSMHPKATPVLIKDWSYEPTDFWGVFLKEALEGKTFEMKKMR
ncbi:glycoside hydrolase family 5 protein [Coraliomargarita parva]|uniref:glycoside hydrolase family 5 protein n=1 Tax=Coraliomargarita parva TaxID=3014050 RepID=UPI0022B4E8FB|nr:glycoside hydrolase family 5 protein [Coraliomargarita parva]